MTGDGALADVLVETWRRQADNGFLLSPPDTAGIEERLVHDDVADVDYRLRWLPQGRPGDVPDLHRDR